MFLVYTLLCLSFLAVYSSLTSRLQARKGEQIHDVPFRFLFGLLRHFVIVDQNLGKPLLSWKEKLGPVYTIEIPGIRALVLNDLKSVNECFGKDGFAGRPRVPLAELIMKKSGNGIGFNQGPHVREQRWFLQKAFREFPNTEFIVNAEMTILIENWKSGSGKPFSLAHAFPPYTLNMVCRLLGSRRLTDDQNGYIIELIDTFDDVKGNTEKLAFLFPSLVGKLSNVVERKLSAVDSITTIMRALIADKEPSRIPLSPQDVMDKYRDVVSITENPNSSFHVTCDSMAPVYRDIVAAGTQTIATAISWFVLLLLHHPRVVVKLQSEIDNIIGSSRTPSLDDKQNMPYAEACIYETLRWATVIPSIARSAMTDTLFRGKLIPEGTILVANIYGLHHDPAVWENPEMFLPERFLTQNGKTLDKNMCSKTMPFGTGKRSCLGLGFIIKQLFLITTGIYQRFDILNSGPTIPTLDGYFGIEHRPASDVQVVAVPR